MTEYLLSVHHTADEAFPEDEAEIQEIYADVEAFNAKLRAEGAWVFAGGLLPIESATTVDATGAEVSIVDGPFAESKEYLGGFWVVQAPDLDAALAWATEGSAACRGKVEVRPFQSE